MVYSLEVQKIVENHMQSKLLHSLRLENNSGFWFIETFDLNEEGKSRTYQRLSIEIEKPFCIIQCTFPLWSTNLRRKNPETFNSINGYNQFTENTRIWRGKHNIWLHSATKLIAFVSGRVKISNFDHDLELNINSKSMHNSLSKITLFFFNLQGIMWPSTLLNLVIKSKI